VYAEYPVVRNNLDNFIWPLDVFEGIVKRREINSLFCLKVEQRPFFILNIPYLIPCCTVVAIQVVRLIDTVYE
jgi:hypothetical protein